MKLHVKSLYRTTAEPIRFLLTEGQKEALQYRIDLQLPTVLLYIRFPSKSMAADTEINRILLQVPSFSVEGNGDTQIIMIQNEADVDPTIQTLSQISPEAFIAVSQKKRTSPPVMNRPGL